MAEPMDDDQGSEASDIISVYSGSSDTPGGEMSTHLVLKYHADASSSILSHLKDRGYGDYVTDHKIFTANSSKITVPKSVASEMISRLNGSRVKGHRLTVEPFRPRSNEKGREKNSDHHGSSVSGNCCLYVGSNLPEYTNEQHFRDHFGKFAPCITKIELVRDKQKKFKGFGFITFNAPEVAAAALKELNHSTLLGMCIQVNFDNRKSTIKQVEPSSLCSSKKEEDDFSDSESVMSESVYSDQIKVIVHTKPKLPNSVRNSAFKKHFRDFQSDIANCFVCRDRNTKQSKGFGIVFFKSIKAAEYAVEKMRGTKIMDKFEIISLGITKDKSNSPSKVQPSPSHVTGSFQFPLGGPNSPDSSFEANRRLSLDDRPARSNPQDSVIIENLTSELTESSIRSLVKVPMLSCVRTSSSAVLIKCHSVADADRVVRELNNKTILDRCIHARLALPSHPVLPFSAPPSHPVLPFSNVSPASRPGFEHGLSSGDLLFPVSSHRPDYQRGISSVSTVSQFPNPPSIPNSLHEATVQPGLQRTLSTMSMESEAASPSSLAGATSVKVTHISRSVIKEQVRAHFTSAGNVSDVRLIKGSPFQYAYVNYFDHASAQRAVDMLNQSSLGDTQITVKLTVNKNIQSSEEISDEKFECVLKLNSKQWNTLMLVNPSTESTMFNDVMAPFTVNPDVTFTPDYQSQSIKFSGKRETAEYTYNYLLKLLDREITIERDKMEALYHLVPNLSSDILSVGAKIAEYGPTLTTIKFDGSPEGIQKAHKHVSTLISRLYCEKVQLQHEYPQNELEKLRNNIYSTITGGKVFISLSPDSISGRILPIWCLDSNLIKAALPGIIQLVSVSCVKLECSSEEAVYIKHFCRSSIARFSLKVELNDDGIMLQGTPGQIQQSKVYFTGTVLSGLLSKKYSFSCKIAFKDHMEQTLLLPYSTEETSFKYLTVVPTKDKSQKRRQTKQEGGSTFDVYFYCTNREFFLKVSQLFDSVNPRTKRYPITQEGVEKVVMEMKNQLENKYRVKISQNNKSSCFFIDALIPSELQGCLDDINEQVGRNVKTTKYINISSSLYSLLKLYKDDIAELRKNCEVTVLPQSAGNENCTIRLKGTISQVEEVQSSLAPLVEMNVFEESFVLLCPSFLFGMWLRRWNQIKEQEEKTKTVVIFSKQSTEKEDSRVTVNFRIIGCFDSCVQEVKTTIMSEGVETEEKVFSLTPSGISCLLTAKKEKKLGEVIKDIVYFKHIDRQHNKVTLVAPKELSDSLETAEEQVRKFVGERASTSYVICSKDPVVNLILSNSSKSMEFVTRANVISKQHHVSVIIQKKPVGLRLSGVEASVSIVKPLIKSVILDSIEKTVGESKISVKSIYIPWLKSPEFLQFESKLGSELCVTCSYPKAGRSSKVVSSSELATDTPGQVIKVDICKGDLVHEQVDVIVNAANEDLKHIGGLAKAIFDAGGPSIQQESDDFTATRKKMKAGEAVCLGSGDLPCKYIVHAVGPRWSGGRNGEEQLLYFSVFRSFQEASKQSVTSIAFPAIGTGIFGVPEDVCARMSLKAVRDFFHSESNTTINQVKFVLYNQSTVTAFLSALQNDQCGDYQPCATVKSKKVVNAGSFPSSPAVSSPSTFYSSALPSQSCNWQWRNDQGGFSPYSSSLCSQLEAAFHSNPQGSFQLVINGANYVIDFSRMLQINIQTRGGRNIIRNNSDSVSSSSSDVQWLYNDGPQYMPYTPQQSASIEKMYQDGVSGQLVINGTTYNIDPVQMLQRNSATNYPRKIQRQVNNGTPSDITKSSSVGVQKVSAPFVPVQLNSQGHVKGRSNKEDIIITLRGPHDSLHTAEERLKGKLEKSLYKRCFDKFPKGVTEDLEKKLGLIAEKNSVSWSFVDVPSSDGKSQRVMNLEGVYFKCKSALEAIQEEVLTFHVNSVGTEDDICFPPEWQQQSKTTEVFTLNQGTSEWNNVYSKFSATMSGNQIVEISRIQNKWLWEKYASHKKRLDRKNHGAVNEKELFHGTRENDPRNIYEGEEGFDMRFSAQGMWGMANYFAVNASYSSAYSFASPRGRQMFLVKVLTGDSHQCPSNRSLRMPPIKTAGQSGTEVQFVQTRYDTVTGQTGGSQVFMTYDNDKAYPAYLITYN